MQMYEGLPKEGDICLGAESADCETDELRIRIEDGSIVSDSGVSV